MTLATLLLLAVFVWLGHWQWQRGMARAATWVQFQQDTAAVQGATNLDALPRFARVSFDCAFEAHQFLLDNRPHAGRPGYEVLTPCALDDGRRVLVNRGWVPFTGRIDQLPDVAIAGARAAVRGRLDDLPVGGLASGHAAPEAKARWPRVTSYPTQAELETALGSKLAQRIVLLDPGAAAGYVREWTPPGLSPERHFSYAIQWWGFAVVLLVLYFALNFRKVS